jgi:hypothetical protein
LAAGVLAVAIGVGATAQPAHADWQPKTPEDMQEFTRLTDTFARFLDGLFGDGGGDQVVTPSTWTRRSSR